MESVLKYLPSEIAREAEKYIDIAEEIRLMAGGGAAVVAEGEIFSLDCRVSRTQLQNILNFICRGAAYSSQTELREGFVTIEGGHRVGVCGRLAPGNSGGAMVEPSALCFRIAREIKGAADKIKEYIGKNILVISPPGCGKTTLLRDAARIAGNKMPVCVVDERSELAAVYRGEPQMDVGKYTCVLDRVKKAKGMLMALRAMSPKIIVTDEIGSNEDADAVYEIINAGVRLMTSVHGYGREDVRRRGRMGELLDGGLFDVIVILKNRGEIEAVRSGA